MKTILGLIAVSAAALLLGARPAPPPDPGAIYAKRELRRARTIVELRLLELRRERLERASAAIARGLSIDDLLRSGGAGSLGAGCETNRHAGL